MQAVGRLHFSTFAQQLAGFPNLHICIWDEGKDCYCILACESLCAVGIACMNKPLFHLLQPSQITFCKNNHVRGFIQSKRHSHPNTFPPELLFTSKIDLRVHLSMFPYCIPLATHFFAVLTSSQFFFNACFLACLSFYSLKE